ncbi:MAG: TIR domain-containing protein [Chloroflexota bacterium]|nr:TIR domain-containing protein [Chloroflexota bacterium]MDE2884820.1 TIR domain-containing protein [Chloroflexota bacterium]
MSRKHNVFLSYYHEQDQRYKDRFVRMMGDNIVDKSVDLGDIIDDNLPTEAVLQRIREDHIAQVSVTIVLIGPCTWQRKYVDWEIGASLRDTQHNPRCGLLGILLPEHPDFQRPEYSARLIPPRLADNCDGDNSFAQIRDWTRNVEETRTWIHEAFLRRRKQPDPNNSRLPFGRNWNGDCVRGWQ